MSAHAAATDADRFRRIEEIFRAAARLDPAHRAAFVASEAGDDARLAAEVTALLAEDDAAKGPLDTPALDGLIDAREFAAATAPPHRHLPEFIGRYRITGIIGEGGMGTVYRAEQASPRRTVAVKVIRRGSVSPQTRRRFEFEAEVLARLQHPGIAAILEAGEDPPGGPGGQLFFAMELVRGVPLLRHAEDRSLSIRDRLDLFARICDAVQHAHQHGVIHRDLKPSNILVDEAGGDGQPKILDFGVARATDSDLRATMQTDAGQIVGTLHYMSPEQAAGDQNAIDTRTDVYSLGVILYELLTGRLPFHMAQKSVVEAIRLLREHAPDRPSTVDRRLRGDAETITLRALERDPARRYQSAADLAADVRRYLRSEPIMARPPSAAYHLGRFAARNRALVAAFAAVFITLVGALVTVSFSLAEAERQRTLAQRRADVLAGVNGFLTEDVIAAADPWSGGDPQVSLVEALKAAGPRVKDRFGSDPAAEAAVREALGTAYLNLNLFDAAAEHLTAAYEMTATLRDPAALADRGMLLATLQLDTARYDEAARTLEAVIAGLRRDLPGDRGRRSAALAWLANVYGKMGRSDDSMRLYAQVADEGRRHAPDAPDTINAITSLAMAYQQVKRYAEAEPLSIEAARRSAAAFGAEHPDTLTARTNLGLLYLNTEQWERAEPILAATLAARERVLGDDHRHTNMSRAMLAVALSGLGRHAEAEPLALSALEKLSATLGEDHPYCDRTRRIIVRLYESWGKPAEADRYRPAPGPAG